MRNEEITKKFNAVRMLESGVSMNKICTTLKVHHYSVKLWYAQYQSGGVEGLYSTGPTRQKTTEEKLSIVRDIVNNDLSLDAAVSKYHISRRTLHLWKRLYSAKGLAGLRRKNECNSMKKRRVYTPDELDELEQLRMRNEWLEAENALLKKVKALVEAREARQREIGQKPSKN